MRKNILFQEFDNNIVVICLAWNGFNPLGRVVHRNQDVLVIE